MSHSDPKLRLAAFLGDAEARSVVVDRRAFRPGTDRLDEFLVGSPQGGTLYVEWRARIDAWMRETLLRASIAVARHALSRVSHPTPEYFGSRAVASLEDWLSCQCSQHAAAVEAAHEAGRKATFVNGAADVAIWVATDVKQPEPENSISALLGNGAYPAQTAPAVLVDVLRAELVPWLRGHSDPVRERVANR
jgi:hypothetical protein